MLLRFRDLANGSYFLPILPNSVIHGYAPGVAGNAVHLMTLTDDGIQLAGLLIKWSFIEGVSVADGKLIIHNNVFLVGGFSYCTERMSFREDLYDEPSNFIQGYPVYEGLLNRITYEQQSGTGQKR